MGIPTFFRHIIDKYPETHFWREDFYVDNFYLDFNSIVYGVIPEIDVRLGYVDYENELIHRIIEKLHHVICNVVKPRKMVYIAVDGTVPRAKMVQQRARRYKSIKESNFVRDVEKRYGVSIPASCWNRNSISPGTAFMHRLGREIIHNIQRKYFQTHNSKLVVIFNDDSVPGEGEHKILPNLRKVKGGEVSVIYSPDADLIVLSVLSGVSNIFILRDARDTGATGENYSEFLYLDINTCKRIFGETMTSDWTGEGVEEREKRGRMEVDEGRVLTDYCFITFLCGNDFVTPVPFLKIKEGGIDILIGIYKKLYADLREYLVGEDYGINYVFLHCLLKELAAIEDPCMKKWQRKRDRIRKGAKGVANESESDREEPWSLEIKRFNHEEYYSPAHPMYEVFNRLFDQIDYYKEDWGASYNRHFFEDQEVDCVCREYLKSLRFCLLYYFKGVPSWNWYYKYRNAPTMKDLSDYLGRCIDAEEEGSVEAKEDMRWELGRPYLPFEQLMLILPKSSFKLLPKCLSVDSMSRYYPINFKLDVLQGTKYIYSVPILPDIPETDVREKIAANEHNFSSIEKKRNTLRNKPYVHKG